MARKTYSEEEIQKRIDALPEAAANFLYSAEMSGAIKGIADKHRLHIDQMSLLEAEAGELILGLTEPQDFAPYITESLKINGEQAVAIAKDISEQVVSKIRTSMGQPSGAGAPVGISYTPKPAPTASPIPESLASSVTMPSSAPKPIIPPIGAPIAPAAVAPTPVFTPSTPASPEPKPATAAVSAPKLAATPNLGAADAILSEKKVSPPAPTTPTTAAASPTPASVTAPAAASAPKTDPAQPQPYKADPYREPVE